MHSNITGKINNLQSPEELNIICVANAFNFVIRQVIWFQVLIMQKLLILWFFF